MAGGRGSPGSRSPGGRSTSNSPIRISRRSRSRSPIRKKRSRSPRGKFSRDIKGKECRVFVTNLSYDAKWMEVKDVMKKHGKVVHVELLTDSTGRPKGTGIVEFTTSEDAARAIKELDGYDFQGRKLRLREDRLDDAEYENQLRTQKEKSRKQTVSRSSGQGPPPSSGGRLGAILSGGGGSGGGGGGGGPAQLVNALNNKGGDPINSSVFVTNLDFDVTWQKLKDQFKRAGKCIRCDIAEGDDNRSKGFGSAQFETPFEALTAVAMFNGSDLGSRRRKMTVRLDRASNVHQILEQLGIPPNDVTEKTIQQLQSIATLSTLTSSGALSGLGLLSQLASLISSSGNQSSGSSSLSSLASLSALDGLGTLLTAGLGSSLSSLTGTSSSSANSSMARGGGNNGGGGASGRGGNDSFGNRESNRRNSGYDHPPNKSVRRRISGCQVFVQNLPFSVSWQDLKDKFKEIGRVARADIKTNEDGRSKGCGTVAFEIPEDAERAVSLLNRTQMEGREIEVRIDRMV